MYGALSSADAWISRSRCTSNPHHQPAEDLYTAVSLLQYHKATTHNLAGSRSHAGKLIYTLYGAKTENVFVKTWGIGLAIENATEFQDLVNNAFQAFLILLLLDLVITGPSRWVRSPLF